MRALFAVFRQPTALASPFQSISTRREEEGPEENVVYNFMYICMLLK